MAAIVTASLKVNGVQKEALIMAINNGINHTTDPVDAFPMNYFTHEKILSMEAGDTFQVDFTLDYGSSAQEEAEVTLVLVLERIKLRN
jgi:hypothetical protein